MMSMWLLLATLLLLAFVFIAWPLWRYRNSSLSVAVLNEEQVRVRLAENVRIFREHLAELNANLEAQTIDFMQFAQLRLELERNLLEDEASIRAQQQQASDFLGVKAAAAFGLLVLVGGMFFYHQHSSVSDVAIQALQQEKMQRDYQDMLQNREPDPARAQALIAEYKDRLKAKPDNVQYWFLLARSQMELANFAEAATAYQQVLERDPQSPMIMAELAQAMFLRDGNKMSPPVAELAKSAATLDPKNTMALGLLGIDAFGHKDYRAAIRYWQKSVDLIGADSQGGKALAAGIERAKQQFVAEGGSLSELAAPSPYSIQLAVSLGAKARAKPDQIVFIYARAWKGSPMPLAISRVKVADLPKLVVLDETMAMSPATSLATASEIEVVARISPEGSAQAKVGDWQAKQGPISMNSKPQQLQLEINEQLTAESLSAQ